jgi:hypothetical protein
MNPAGEDSRRLLTEAGQWTQPWGESEDGTSCEKCEGSGRTRFECWSCLLTAANERCPVCAGAVRWENECPVCRGSGEIDGQPRHGVSVFPTVEGLYHYMLDSGADLDDCVVLELDAKPSGDVDFDADQGAMLVIPREILSCEPVDPTLARDVRSRAAVI